MTDGAPHLRIIKGDATAEEIAAVLMAVSSRTTTAPARQPSRSAWASRSRQIRPPQHPGPDAWRRSSLPR